MKHLHLYAALVEIWLQLLVSFAGGAPPCYVPLDMASIKVLDVDTVRADVELPWGITLRNQTIRLDFDGLETSRVRRGVTITDDEIVRGLNAKEDLIFTLKHAEAAYIQPTERASGGFGRLSASLHLKIRTESKLLDVKTWAESNQYIREEQ